MTIMSESDYKELLGLKHQLQRAEETEAKFREIENLKTRLMTQILGIDSQIQNLQDLKGVYEEILEDL